MQSPDRAADRLPSAAASRYFPFRHLHRSFFGHKRVFEFQMTV
jgi:hypothetical protein